MRAGGRVAGSTVGPLDEAAARAVGASGLSAEPLVVVRALGDPGLAWCELSVDRNPLRRSPRELRRRLNALSDRHGGARAITQAERAIPEAYRRLDPDRPEPRPRR